MNYLPSGARDLLPTDLVRQERFRQIILDTFKSWGYQPVLPPTLESLEALEAGRPKFLKECFKVIDAEGNLLALRPDLTLPIARLAATRLSEVARPLRLCYASKVFRASPHLADERREIYQAGIELIGEYVDQAGSKDNQEDDDRYDLIKVTKSNLECLSILIETLAAIGLKDYKLVLSHTALWQYAGEIFHQIEELLEQDIASSLDQLLMHGKFVDYQRMINQVEERTLKACPEGQSDLKNILTQTANHPLAYLKEACYELTGKPVEILEFLDQDSEIYQELQAITLLEEVYGPNLFLIDFTLRPDPDFYTGLYFEVVVPGYGKSIGHGGRYDNLIASFGRSEPAIGFSLQMDSLLKYTKPENLSELSQMKDALRVPFLESEKVRLIDVIAETRKLRQSNRVVVLD
ncbi:MAG: ATP phosphoribosyltransferase regulatory subunit [Candidatus Caenarcaniphilales bacterium]|nr:ATP phosphoribosyltransferase regulatory subunit [Candidatus Caenarcaniphilales bacterium]